MAKRPASDVARNACITGVWRPTPQDPPPAKEHAKAPAKSAPPPDWLDPAVTRRVARLMLALRRQHDEAQANDPQVIGQELLARRAVIAEVTERIEREGFDAVVNPPAPAPLPEASQAFVAWFRELLRRGLTDGDSLLLARFVFQRLRPPDQNAVGAFLEALAIIDLQLDLAAAAAELRAALAQPAKGRGRGRPKGRHPQAAARNLADARKLFATRQTEGRLTIPNIDPWHVVQNLASVLDQIIDKDRGQRKARGTDGQTDPLDDNSRLHQAWYGDAARGLPSLRRWLVIEALAWHCLNRWLDQYHAEAGKC